MSRKLLPIFISAFVLFSIGCSDVQHKVSNSLKSTGESMEIMGDDIKIRHKITEQMNRESEFTRSHIVVSSFNYVVLLAGQAPNQRLKQRAEEIARSIKPSARKVYNEITIAGPTTTLTRSSDAWLTTKLKPMITAKLGVPASSIKVVTENGTVFLMGEVNRAQAKEAVKIARHTTGVQRVVNLFEIE